MVLCPGLSYLFVGQNFLLVSPETNFTSSARSIAAVILCCFSESNISLALAFKHLNNKLAVYVYEAVECFGKQI